MATRLTANTKAGGCAAKLSPKILDRVLAKLPRLPSKQVLVGYETSDDAGVFDITGEANTPLALVQTVDFFTPIVDDPYTFGAIAAANALSDIYAMGGRPLSALSIVVYPSRGDLDDLEAILLGGAEKIHQAGCVVLGGHSISDDQIKFGYAVTGLVKPDAYWTNTGAQAGDVLVFTKRLGTGIISSALKLGLASEPDVKASIEQMTTLNRAAAGVLSKLRVHACTDVTGFGLLGHAREMAIGSRVTLEINTHMLRFLPGAFDYARAGASSGGLHNNREFVSSCVQTARDLDPALEALLYDPQTSGGLLVSLPENDAQQLLAECQAAYIIGQVKARAEKPIEVAA